MKRKRKRNPRLQGVAKEILSEVDDWEFLNKGGDGEIFYFIINSHIRVNNVLLKSNEYILKILNNKSLLKENEINYLTELSNLNLIPQIYYIDNKIQIMKYIEGKTFRDILEKRKILNYEFKQIVKNIKSELIKWHKLNYYHGDLTYDNILVDKNYKIYFIDPNVECIEDNLSDCIKYDEYTLNNINSLYYEKT